MSTDFRIIQMFFSIIIFHVFFFSGCSPASLQPTISSSDTPIPVVTLTPRPSLTSTYEPTLTNTPQPTNTPEPTNSQTSTVTPDLSIVGKPENPFPSRWPKPIYNDKDFDVYQRKIHGRLITIAWEKSANIASNLQKEVSGYYFESFVNWWKIFQGFPYESYTVVLKQKGKNTGEKGNGYEVTASDYGKQLDVNLKERISHEVFHAWVGNGLCDAQEVKFDDGLWFREGFTQYYVDRGSGPDGYHKWMNEHLKEYRDRILGTQYDIPMIDLPAKNQSMGGSVDGENRQFRLNVYWKGALVAYMIDEQLHEKGLSLDDYLKYLYETYSLKQKCFKTTNAIQALNVISEMDWNDFFQKYIYGTEELPLDSNIKFLDNPTISGLESE